MVWYNCFVALAIYGVSQTLPLLITKNSLTFKNHSKNGSNLREKKIANLTKKLKLFKYQLRLQISAITQIPAW